MPINENYYVNVQKLMEEKGIPILQPVIYVTGWNEWLPLISVEV